MSPGRSYRRYFRCTRTATYGFLAALPLLAFYEFAIVLGGGASAGVRLGAELWTKELLAMLGIAGHLALAAVVLLIGGVIFWRERGKRIPIRGRYFIGLLFECCFYAVGLAAVVSRLVGVLFAQIPTVDVGTIDRIAFSVGAGLYEELLFRVLLVGGLFALLRQMSKLKRSRAYAAAAVLAALCFSAVHYIGPLGDVFTLPSFTFRFLFGLALNALYVLRGFGAAAWTHALYDIMLLV